MIEELDQMTQEAQERGEYDPPFGNPLTKESTMNHKENIEALVDAGKKATQGTWLDEGGRLEVYDILEDEDVNLLKQAFPADLDFMAQAANSRPSLEWLLAENERMREALEVIEEESSNAFPTDEMNIIHRTAKQTLNDIGDRK